MLNENDKVHVYGCAIAFNYIDQIQDIIPNTTKIYYENFLPMKLEHNHTIGVWEKFYINKYGFFTEGYISNINSKLINNIAFGYIGLSIGFYIKKYKFNKINTKNVRIIDELDLVEISLTKNPANDLCGCMLNNLMQFK